MTDLARPKIKIQLTTTDKIIEVVGLLVLIGFWFFTLFYYKQLPDIIPTHFGAEGKPDGFGEKYTILFLPIVGSLIYIALTILARFPHKMNYTAMITEANAAKLYTTMTRMLRVLKVVMVLVFFVLDYKTIQIALELPDLFGKWFLLLVFALVFVPIFYFLIQISKNS